NLTGEALPIIINSIPGASSTNTIKIKPASGVTTAITGSVPGGLVLFNGAKFVTLDGSNNGTGSRDLTITNTNTGLQTAVIWLQTTTSADPATNNTIKNANLIGSSTTALPTTVAGIGSGSATVTVTSFGNGNNNNTYQNNNITSTNYGIYSAGASAANKNT